MAVELTISGNLFAQTTPAGAYYAVASPNLDNNRQALINILKSGENTPLGEAQVLDWTGANSLSEGLNLLFRLQRLGFIRGVEIPVPASKERLEDILPSLLSRLSDKGKAVLADDNGFYLATSGFPHEAAEELAGLAADLLALHTRHGRLLKNNVKIGTEAWALVDPAGRSELGFWPLFIGKQNFILIIGETPRLQNQEFVTLIQALNNRYA